MSEISSNNYLQYSAESYDSSISQQNNSPPANNELEAHYSENMKISRPKLQIAEAPSALPSNNIFSDKEATAKIQAINTDIFESSKKEKSKHEFNRSLYFKIFGCITLATAGIAGYSRIKKFFKKS